MAITCYLDDSGSHEGSPDAVMAGLGLHEDQFVEFDLHWTRILHRHRIQAPLQMVEFVKPQGKYAAMYEEMKMALFLDVVKAIVKHRIYSVAVSVPQQGERPLFR